MLCGADWLLVADLSGQPNVKQSSCIVWPLKMGLIGFPETSVTNYQSAVHDILEGWRYQIDFISEDMRITQNDTQLSQNIEQFWDIMPHPFVNSYHFFSKPCSFYVQEYWGNNQPLWYASQFTSQHGVTFLKTLLSSVT